MTTTNSAIDFYANQDDITTLSGLSFIAHKVDFGRTMDRQLLVNDHATKTLEYSYDGITRHGEAFAGEEHSFDERRRRYLYLRAPLSATTSGVTFRIWAWASV